MGDIRLEAEDTVLGVGVACEDTMVDRAIFNKLSLSR